MTTTAHGWTVQRAVSTEVASITHVRGGNVSAPAGTTGDLARCIEDAATLVEARRLAPLIDDLTVDCPYCWYPTAGHGRDDGCPHCDLLALLSEEATR